MAIFDIERVKYYGYVYKADIIMSVNSVKISSSKPAVPSFSGIERKTINLMPAIHIGNGRISKYLKWAGEHISSPEQRLLMGVTALFTQPFIDLNNKRVNEDTRLMSFSRTLAKIIVGTTVGVIVRRKCIHLASNFTEMLPKSEKAVNYAIPADTHSFFAPERALNFSEERRQEYIKTVGTLMGLVVMLFTNFFVDAPLTVLLTNAFYKNLKKEGGENETV